MYIRLFAAVLILNFSAAVQSTPITSATTAIYVLASGNCTDGPDFDSCSVGIGPVEQTVTSASRTFEGDQAEAAANLESQQVGVKIIDTGPVGVNQAYAILLEGYRFDPLATDATFDFEYLFEGIYSGLSLDGNKSQADLMIQLVPHGGGGNDIPIIRRSLADVTGGQEIVSQTINLLTDTYALDLFVSLSAASIEGGTIDMSNTAGYSISFSEEFGEVSRLSGLQLDPGSPTIPAPATLALFGLGLAGLGWSRRKKA